MSGMTVFRLLLAIAWVILLLVTIRAVTEMGLAAVAPVFFGDFAHPWRAQFYSDFALHLLLTAAWVFYRERSWVVGAIGVLLVINLGGLFTLAYLFVASYRAGGDPRRLVLGDRA